MEKYTTQDIISKDTTNKEKEKVVISNDSYAVTEALNSLINVLVRYR
jgi:hypothetical protein